MPNLSHRDIKDFKINPSLYADKQVLSYDTATSKFINSVSYSNTATLNTLALRTSNGCIKSAEPVDADDVATKGYISTYLSSSLITSLFKDSAYIDFTVDSLDGLVYASSFGQGVTGSMQIKATNGYVAGSSIFRQDMTNNFLVASKDSTYTLTTRGLYTSTINKNNFNYSDILLESISNNLNYGAAISTHTFYNLNADSTVAKRAVGSASGNTTQNIFSLENYASTGLSTTQKAFSLNVISDGNWSNAGTRNCHFEIFQNGATNATIMKSNAQGDVQFGNGIRVGAVAGTAVAGLIQWNGTNLQNYNGASWVNLDSVVARYDNVTITEDPTWGLMVKDGGLTVTKVATGSLATGTSNNSKLTTQGYVDGLSSYQEFPITNVSSWTHTHTKGRFLTIEVYVFDSVNNRYELGTGTVTYSADKNTITATFSANYTGYVVLRG